MNPYRIKSNKKSIEEIITEYKEYPNNPASQESNIMTGKDYFYLNPGLQNVRKFVVDTVLEFISKYKEVDAIHFDDYFYNNDENSGGDEKTYKESNGTKNKADWRREQVDLLIESLHNEINNFNKENKKYIQFGISPSGIYKNSPNGNDTVTYDSEGNIITKGSATNGSEHYQDHLFSDTLKWINNEWIDYILPQIYWAHDNENAPFKNVIDWWNKVVLKKRLIYM